MRRVARSPEHGELGSCQCVVRAMAARERVELKNLTRFEPCV